MLSNHVMRTHITNLRLIGPVPWRHMTYNALFLVAMSYIHTYHKVGAKTSPTMPDLETLFKEYEHLMTSADLQLYKDFIDGTIKPKSAAKSLTKDIDMTIPISSPLYRCLGMAMTLAISSLDSSIQKKFIQLASAIRTLRKRSLNLGNETPSHLVLGEIDEMIGDWWNCEYQLPSIFYLPSDPDADIILYLALWSDSRDPNQSERHLHWISLNEFAARLTKANICDWAPNASLLCDELLDEPELRVNPSWFAIALSAAAQFMIHAGLNVYIFFKTQRSYCGNTFRWGEWKTVFRGAEAVENDQARNDALCAAKAMDSVERIYNSLQAQANRKIATRGMLNQSERVGDGGLQPEQKNRRKRGVDQAFPS